MNLKIRLMLIGSFILVGLTCVAFLVFVENQYHGQTPAWVGYTESAFPFALALLIMSIGFYFREKLFRDSSNPAKALEATHLSVLKKYRIRNIYRVMLFSGVLITALVSLMRGDTVDQYVYLYSALLILLIIGLGRLVFKSFRKK
jgi:hypothetical protein